MRKLPAILSLGAVTTLLLAGLGCGREEVKTVRIPKENETSPIQWKLPSGWEQLPPSQMRVGSFAIKDKDGQQADVSIIPLANMGARDLDNVNRWRGQVGLEPITQEEMAKTAEKVEIAGTAGQLFDMAGKPAGQKDTVRVLASMLDRDGTTWFFKMTGSDSLVQREKTNFVGFLKSISFSANTALQSATPSGLAPVVPPETPSAADLKPNWKVPPGWQEQPPGAMQLAKFAINATNQAKTEVTVAAFPGTVGGTLANINRWRGQIGLPFVDDKELASLTNSIDVGSVKATLVDMAGQSGTNRLVAAMVPKGDRTWFYKMAGDQEVVGREKSAFIEFVQSAK